MWVYVSKRVITGFFTILLSLCISFVLIHAAPGNPIRLLAGMDSPSEEMIQMLMQKYGLDKPLYAQFFDYVKTLCHGDLGYSIVRDEPVARLIAQRVRATLYLALPGAVLGVALGAGLGILCARKSGSKLDTFVCGISYVFDSTPSFWLGMMLLLVFASWLRLLPTSGMVNLRAAYQGIHRFFDVLLHLALPLTTVTLWRAPYFFRIARASVLQVMNEDYVTVFRATGMSESKIFRKYVFKNAMLPIVTVFGITLAYVITGVTIVEIVFSWPGMGSLMMDAIFKRDYPLLMGLYLAISVSVVFTMIGVDVVYAMLDPRIRFTEE